MAGTAVSVIALFVVLFAAAAFVETQSTRWPLRAKLGRILAKLVRALHP
jgi:hypothetical protein